MRRRGPETRARRIARRSVDLLTVLVAAPVVGPLVLLLGAIVKLDSPGPMFVVHQRVGRGGRPFEVFKLRTMVENAEALKAELQDLNVLPWPDFKIPDDPRVTRPGRWLRRSSLDELPQLWNLLRGELTLVGPRPCSIDVAKYQLWQTERLEATPGLFGRWQAEARGTTSFDERCRMDIAEIRTASVRDQLKVAVKTIRSVFTGQGAS